MQKIILRLFIVFALSIISKLATADCWQRQYPAFPTESLRAMVFTSPSDGIVVGDGGLIARSADSGGSWTPLNYITTQHLYALTFPSPLKGWAAGAGGTILKTIDGGFVWNAVTSFPDSINIKSVSFKGTDTGYIAGDSCVWRTYDGGVNWTRCLSIFFAQITYVKVFGDTVYAFEPNSRIQRSYDRGQTWTSQQYSTNYLQVDFATTKVGWAVSNNGYWKTTNGGATWTQQYTVNGSANLGNMQALDTSNIFILQNGNSSGVHNVIYSNNGGATWTSSYNLSLLYNTCLYFRSSTSGTIGSMYGIIYTTNNPASTYTQRTQLASSWSGMRSIDFSDTLHGIIGGASLTWRTANGGLNWIPGGTLSGNTTTKSVQMVDSSYAWLVGDNGYLFKSTNGGTTWSSQLTSGCLDARFSSRTFGMIVTSGAVRVSNNGGSTWSNTLSISGINFKKVTCADSLIWFVQGTGSFGVQNIYKSVNGGTTWSQALVGYDGFTNMVAFDSSRIYAGTVNHGSDNVVKSTDGGSSFSYTYPYWGPNYLSAALVSFCDTMHGMVTSSDVLGTFFQHPVIAKTSNACGNWQIMPINSGSTLTSVVYRDSAHAWLCTLFGSIYRYYATCPSVPITQPILNRSAHFGCAGTSLTLQIANWDTYGATDTFSAALKLGSTIVATPTIGTTGSVSFTLPATAGSYVLEIKVRNITTPQGSVTVIPIGVQTTVIPTVTAVPSTTLPTCQGSSTTLIASVSNGGTAPAFQWKVNSVNVGANSNFITYIPSNGDVVTVTLASSAACASPASLTSAGVTMTVNPTVTPSVTVAASTSATICAGTSVTYTATPTSGGSTPNYEWLVNGISSGTASTYTYTPANGDTVRVILMSSASCPSPVTATSANIIMTVTPTVTPSVSISSSATNVCAGTAVNFSASPTNGGVLPSYQWKVNGVNVGASSNSYSYTPANGDTIRCILTSNAVCPSPAAAISSAIVMAVSPVVTPSVGILAAPGTAVCSGTTIAFTPTPSNGGSSPVYQWKLNGTTVAATTTYYNSTLQTGDVVAVTLTSNAQCTTTPTASGSLTATVYPLPTPVITRSGTSLNVSTTGATYNWLLNGVAILGATGSFWTPVQNGTYSVIVTDAHGCTAMSPDFLVQYVSVEKMSGSTVIVNYYPNPAQSTVNISSVLPVDIAVLSIEGKLLLSDKSSRQINISSLPDGLYMLRISKAGELLKMGKIMKFAQ